MRPGGNKDVYRQEPLLNLRVRYDWPASICLQGFQVGGHIVCACAPGIFDICLVVPRERIVAIGRGFIVGAGRGIFPISVSRVLCSVWADRPGRLCRWPLP